MKQKEREKKCIGEWAKTRDQNLFRFGGNLLHVLLL